MDEWKECRATLGRMDTLLEDLRKYGFSLVTGLLTASGLVGGIAQNRPVLPLASLVIMVLVVALFGEDLYYQVLLSGAAERALDLEAVSTMPPLRITKLMTDYAIKTHAVSAIFALYVTFLLTAAGMGLFGSDKVAPRALVGVVGLVLLSAMTASWSFVRDQTKLDKRKPRTWT